MSMRFAGAGLAGAIMGGSGSKYHGFGAVVCITIQQLLYGACGMYFRSETGAAWENGHISNKIWRSTGIINTNTRTCRKIFREYRTRG